jgi:histidine triad (HIT) family protein
VPSDCSAAGAEHNTACQGPIAAGLTKIDGEFCPSGEHKGAVSENKPQVLAGWRRNHLGDRGIAPTGCSATRPKSPSILRDTVSSSKGYRAQVSDCGFCAILAGGAGAHFVIDGDDVAALLDNRPLFKGHVLVLPRAHYETLADLPPGLISPLFGLVQRLSAVMPAALGAQGSFVAINNKVSQSVPHLHVHVVPRTKGDGLRGFFWPRSRYASEDEAASYAARLRDALAAEAGPVSSSP